MGFIGIDRGLRDHWVYQDAEYLKVWMEMLFLARFSEEPHNELIDGDLITVSYGQFIFGRVKWSERLKISEQRLRTLITKLKKAKMIDVVDTHRKCSVYEILNYAKFNHHDNHHSTHAHQGIEDDTNHQDNQLPTSSQPAANQQPTTKEQGSNKVNKVNKVKQEVIKEIFAEKVSLSIPEYEKLIIKYGSEENAKWGIEKLSNYKCSKKTKYTSDYHVLIGWVFDDFEKKKLIVLEGGQARASKPESGRQSNAAEYYANDAQGKGQANVQNAAVSGGTSGGPQLDLNRFVRR